VCGRRSKVCFVSKPREFCSRPFRRVPERGERGASLLVPHRFIVSLFIHKVQEQQKMDPWLGVLHHHLLAMMGAGRRGGRGFRCQGCKPSGDFSLFPQS
jgi:hypothetical protein